MNKRSNYLKGRIEYLTEVVYYYLKEKDIEMMNYYTEEVIKVNKEYRSLLRAELVHSKETFILIK